MLRLALLFVLVFSSPFSIVVTSLGEERAGLCGSRAFIYFERVDFCLSSLPVGVISWLRLVIEALLDFSINLMQNKLHV